MKRVCSSLSLLLLLSILSCSAPPDVRTGDATAEQAIPQPPSVVFGDFYARVALSDADVFEDSKQWADATPRRSPAEILERAGGLDTDSPEALRGFLDDHFVLDPASPSVRLPTAGLPLREHIAELWPLLTRQTIEAEPYSSRLPLPHPYVVPGGRFREVYYWDSWFTMLGFGPGQAALKHDMVANFAHLIRTYGHIPNGNRTYYLSRSQPPFFFRMVELLSPDRPSKAFAEYLPELQAEHAFWMQDSAAAKPGEPARRVVYMPDGSLLNRYWDARDTPRDESYREDEAIAALSDREDFRLYRDIRAAAESGWDFSSRWLADGRSLSTMQTTAIVPPDLNSLLYGLEQAIAEGCRTAGDLACVQSYEEKAAARRAAMHKYLWNEATGLFDDYHWREQRNLGHVTAAALYPLFAGLATDAQAARTAVVVSEQLVRDGGLVATDQATGEQWDAPNGWAPLQWIAVTGLRRYGRPDLAETIARRWLAMVSAVYQHTGKLLEKYDVVTLTPGGGGEYPLQDGFGWTNGVTIGLLRLYPDAHLRQNSGNASTDRTSGPHGGRLARVRQADRCPDCVDAM
ncbi:MAG: alpha,alpha-trehalase TreF [Woeseia sp.]